MLGAPAIAILMTLHHFYVSAQVPQCQPGFTPLYNSLNQTPCEMTIFLGGACNQGSFSLQPLGSDPAIVYLAPTLLSANPCVCSSVYYSLLSACAVCQNHTFLSWSVFKNNCTPTVYEQVFPDPIPSTTRIPHYAYLNVTNGDGFNVTLAESAGGAESTPIPQATGSATASPKRSKSEAGPIAGGVIGGVVFLAILAGLIVLILRRRKQSAPHPFTNNPVASPETLTSYGDVKYNNMIPTSGAPAKIYDPNDPSTFPTNQPVGHSTYSSSPDFSQQRTPVTSPSFTGNTTVSIPAGPHYTGAPEL